MRRTRVPYFVAEQIEELAVLLLLNKELTVQGSDTTMLNLVLLPVTKILKDTQFFKRTYTPPKIEKPPSTQIIAPVTNCEASLSNHTNAPFNSSG